MNHKWTVGEKAIERFGGQFCRPRIVEILEVDAKGRGRVGTWDPSWIKADGCILGAKGWPRIFNRVIPMTPENVAKYEQDIKEDDTRQEYLARLNLVKWDELSREQCLEILSTAPDSVLRVAARKSFWWQAVGDFLVKSYARFNSYFPEVKNDGA